jgi:hypothetical protein
MIARPAPTLELADIIRRHGGALLDDLRRPVSTEQRRVLKALASCRTAALGGHVETCDHCQHQRIAYNSCRNRHCPKCQGSACARWMESRASELLPVEYFHVVFTLPDTFNALALSNQRTVYRVLFDAVAQTLLDVAANTRNLGAKVGFMAVLHTWGQNLSLHPHVHCVIPGGGLSPDGMRWISCRPGFFLPVRILSRVFRGKFISQLRKAFHAGKLAGVPDESAFERLIESSVKNDWVVHAKPPFGGPNQVLKYLSRYTHRIAISNSRLLSMDDDTVTFRWRDYAHGNQLRTMTLDASEFLRRFLLHVVPRGFMRIRHFGFLANRARSNNLELCRKLLGEQVAGEGAGTHLTVPATLPALMKQSLSCCPLCGCGRMVKGELLKPQPLPHFLLLRCDSS